MILTSCCEKEIDFDYPRETSRALASQDTSDTYLGTYVTPLVTNKAPNESGFRPMMDGIDALAIRLFAARKAERTIDAQYYLIKDDLVGRTFFYTLLQAADRGVRVRLLIDDMFTKGYDVGMAALCDHPNFDIRVFNPFRRSNVTDRSVVASLTDFRRINRRMHNKTFTVDNQITVIGGRNMADEYFGVNPDAKFADDDVLAIGPIVQNVSDSFDMYWNHGTALPAPAFVQPLTDARAARDALQNELARSVQDYAELKYSEAVRAKITEYLDDSRRANDDRDMFRWAPYQLVVDSPDKGDPSLAETAYSITTPLKESLSKTERQLIVISPYFVPEQAGIEALSKLANNGIDVSIVTNSLAANNMFMVHGGYAPTRKTLLRAGIKLYEVRADSDVAGAEHIDGSKATTTLHTKEFVVDNKEVFIGSFNFDPRSVKLNTECGVIIRDQEMAEEFAEDSYAKIPTHCFEVFLNHHGKLRWRGVVNGKAVVYRREPQTNWIQRLLGWLARATPNSQL